MKKRLYDLLGTIHTKPLKEQKEFLDRTIEEWRGDKPQTDDITVIGVGV